MTHPNFNIESEDESEVASNISIQESSSHLLEDSSIHHHHISHHHTNDPVTLDLTLGINGSNSEAKDETASTAVEANNNNPTPDHPPPTSRIFSCNYCRRKFYSSQALGGHQNAHKRERTLAKRAMRMGMFSDRYASLSSLPLHGSTAYRSLGIEAHGSMHQQLLVQNNIVQERPPMHGVIKGGARFVDQGYFGYPPVYMDYDEAEMTWPGSFRKIDGIQGYQGFDDSGQGSSRASFVETGPASRMDSPLLPDLNLKL